MKSKTYIFILWCFLGFTTALYCQEAPRIRSIENKLEVLKLDNPEYEEKVNVNITNTTLSNFLLAISKVHGINLNVSPELNSINIINNFTNVSIENLLVFLAKEYNLEIDITGNIISVSRYNAPPERPIIKEINASYNAALNTLSLDLREDTLAKVFRKITDASGKNMVFAPGMEDLSLTAYINNANFEPAMEKLALANNLEVTQSRDGFFIFNRLQNNVNGESVNNAIRITDNFHYRVIDSINKVIAVDFKNVPAKDIIYTIAEDLNLDIFTASPLQNMGTVSVTAESIHFDTLLANIFQSIESVSTIDTQGDPQLNRNLQGNSNFSQQNSSLGKKFTFKKEGELYFFGTEGQLALKQVEVVQMMHRSIEMFTNPTGNTQRRRNNNFTTGGTNFYSGARNNASFNNNNSDTQKRTNDNPLTETSMESIENIIPENILEGIQLKIDSELNSFVVSGPAERIERFKNFIQYIDKPVPVILIEVMILEVNRTAIVETGVSFGLGEEPVQTIGQAFPSANLRLGAETVNRVIGGFNEFGSLNIGNVLPNFYMDIKAMETNGNLKILSTPKLSTLNGHKAHLSSGQTTYYAVTNQSFFGSQIPQTSEVTNYYPIDAELALDIMPFVSGNGEITLEINVVQSSFNGERIAENAPPGMNSREFSSIIRMRDQDVAILGGIEQRTKDDSGNGVPLLARIPVIKWLFSERRRENSKKKLNILIKPTVIY